MMETQNLYYLDFSVGIDYGAYSRFLWLDFSKFFNVFEGYLQVLSLYLCPGHDYWI